MLSQRVLRAEIADVLSITNIAGIIDIADINTDIADISTDIADVINIADIADWIFANIIVETSRRV